MKQVQITVPYEKTEEVFSFLLDGLKVKNVMKFNADNAIVLQFRISDDSVTETMGGLKHRGVGVEYGFVDILDLKASLPSETEEEAPAESKMQREATLAVEEIYENVKKQALLSFDFFAFIILASLMAGLGLVQNDVTVIVASMLLSPLMGPLMGVALGYVVKDKVLFLRGTKNELIGVVVAISVGVITALVISLLIPSKLTEIIGTVGAPTLTEITRRGSFISLDVGIAIFSGAGVALSITRGNMSALVGAAISVSIMPPAVNAAMTLVFGAMTGHVGILSISGGSFMLLAMNIVMIDLSAMFIFRLKKVSAIAKRSATWTAVTQFRVPRSDTLYHHPSPEKSPQEVAVSTPAPKGEDMKKEAEEALSKNDNA